VYRLLPREAAVVLGRACHKNDHGHQASDSECDEELPHSLTVAPAPVGSTPPLECPH